MQRLLAGTAPLGAAGVKPRRCRVWPLARCCNPAPCAGNGIVRVHVSAGQDEAGYGAVLSDVTLSQMATLLQQTQGIAQISMVGQEFMASTLQCTRQFAFEIKALNLDDATEFISSMHDILRNLLSVDLQLTNKHHIDTP